MFTINQIKEVYSKVKSGSDFPAYVQDLVKLGVFGYDTFVFDGHSSYFGKDNYQTQSGAKYTPIEVCSQSNIDKFKSRLKIHQQGKTDYLTFCRDAAENGVEKWKVDTVEMTCTYYDKAGNKMMVEEIPGV